MRWIVYPLAIVIAMSGCKKPYNPPAITSPGSYLVVEGVINAGSDSTFIKLSRTVNISASRATNPVLGAVLTVESDNNATYPLIERGGGYYACPGLNLNPSHQYRLRINTGGEQYLSDFVPVLNAPPIDSINYKIVSTGINIFSNTHDPAGVVKYYRWDYKETYIFNSAFPSYYLSNGDTVIARDLINDQIYTCWRTDTGSSININSTAKLTKDIVANNPITSVDSTSEKLREEYSIIVTQYALTGDAYNFWFNLKKNTEQLGSIFDAQPSQVNGNIHSLTNPNEPVIGYISCGSTSSKRIFINNRQLPGWLAITPYFGCYYDSLRFLYLPPHSTVPVPQEDEFFNFKSKYFLGPLTQMIPLNPVDSFMTAKGRDTLLGHTGSTPQCVDCTLRGTNKQPSFWQ